MTQNDGSPRVLPVCDCVEFVLRSIAGWNVIKSASSMPILPSLFVSASSISAGVTTLLPNRYSIIKPAPGLRPQVSITNEVESAKPVMPGCRVSRTNVTDSPIPVVAGCRVSRPKDADSPELDADRSRVSMANANERPSPVSAEAGISKAAIHDATNTPRTDPGGIGTGCLFDGSNKQVHVRGFVIIVVRRIELTVAYGSLSVLLGILILRFSK